MTHPPTRIPASEAAEREAFERVAEVAETLDNLYHATLLAMPAAFHLKQLQQHMPELRDKLRLAYVAATGENPWE